MIRAWKMHPGIGIEVPEHALNNGRIVLSRDEADRLFDFLGAVLDRDAGLPKDRRMPAPPTPHKSNES